MKSIKTIIKNQNEPPLSQIEHLNLRNNRMKLLNHIFKKIKFAKVSIKKPYKGLTLAARLVSIFFIPGPLSAEAVEEISPLPQLHISEQKTELEEALKGLQSSDLKERIAACKKLAELVGFPPDFIDMWMGKADGQDIDVNVRRLACMALGKLETPPSEVIEALLLFMQDQDESVRWHAAGALGELQVSTPKVMDALVLATQAQKGACKWAAIYALGELKASTPEAVNALLLATKDKDKDVRSAATSALKKLQRANVEVSIELKNIPLNL